MSSRSAILIATDDYEDGGLRRLQAPAGDAARLADLLRDSAIGNFGDVAVLHNEDENVVRRELGRFMANREGDDFLLLYVAGHGVKQGGELYFATRDTDLSILDASAISAIFVSRLINRCRARRVVMLLDCCYSGAFARGMAPRGTEDIDLDDQLRGNLGGTGTAVLTASTATELAFEAGEPQGEGGFAALFTDAVISGLASGDADINHDGRITVGELNQYVVQRVRSRNADQTPTLWLFDTQGEMELASRRAGASARPTVIQSQVGWNLGARPVRTLEGHTGVVLRLAFAPNGASLATSSSDGTVRLWDVATGHLVRVMEHTAQVIAVRFAPNGALIASAGLDRVVRLWRTRTGHQVHTLEHGHPVAAVAFTPDGARLVTGSFDQVLRVWDLATGAQLGTLGDRIGKSVFVETSPDGRLLASSVEGGAVGLWDVETGRKVQTLTDHLDDVAQVAFSPDGSVLASASYDQTVRLWDPRNGTALRTLFGHTARVFAVAFAPNGSAIASAGLDATIRIWHPATGNELALVRGHDEDILDVGFAPDSSLLASCSRDTTVKLWEPRA